MPTGGLTNTVRWLSIAVPLTPATAVGWGAAFFSPPAATHIADAQDSATVTRGRRIYADHCASCHGRYLQGQPLWQLVDDYTGRRAPAHDQTGHTWQHPDEDLFEITKYGRFASTPIGDTSHMPAFGNQLEDGDILAVIAFIKARWPLALRVAEATLNPGHAGMPPGADKLEWKFLPLCKSTLRQANLSTPPRRS
jgi:mono/diheme cytochrome c family protein